MLNKGLNAFLQCKQRTEEWMTADILDLMHCRDKFLYNLKKYGNHDDYVNFNKLRNKVQRDIKRAKSEFFSGKIEENKKNPKKLWQHIKELGLKNKTNDGAKLCLKIANEICHEPKAIADHFVEFCTNVASNLVSKLPACSNIFSVNSERFKLFYSARNVNNATFTLHPVSEDFIFKGPTLSPAYPRIGYITLSCQSQLTGLNQCLWSAKHEMRVHRGDYRKTGADVLRRIFECGEKRKTFIFFWRESIFNYNIHLLCLKS